jgi:serine/threonine-protein phosphatase 2A regulatory subunit A
MVRRSAFTHLGTLASKCSKDHLISVLIQLFLTLSQDSQDSVRLLAVENCIAFAKQLTVEEIEKYILPSVKSCSKDKSWRVRYMVAEHFKNVFFFFFNKKVMLRSWCRNH